MLKHLAREPLVHFIALALLVFAAYALLGSGGEPPRDRIVVTAPKVMQLAEVFAKTWQRPPTAEELKGLVDNYVTEEIYVREAVALKLDVDDQVIRNRLRQKMEFAGAAGKEIVDPGDGELEAFLKANPERFQVEPSMAFQQILLGQDRHGEGIEQAAKAVLDTLKANPDTDPASLGDPSLLPPEMPLTRKSAIGQIFGMDFADAIDAAKPMEWSGPVKSGYGLHVIRTTQRAAGRVPELAEVREAVLREWSDEQRRSAEAQRLAELRKRYEVLIEKPAAEAKP